MQNSDSERDLDVEAILNAVFISANGVSQESGAPSPEGRWALEQISLLEEKDGSCSLPPSSSWWR